MKNKIATILLCLGVAISTLCACSSTGNGGDQPAEETTTKQTEAVAETAETTTELTESETTESETQEGDVIIELFEPVGNIRDIDPVPLKSNFDTFSPPRLEKMKQTSYNYYTIFIIYLL